MRKSILILGGTTEARQLAQALSTRTDIEVTLSLAGRTQSPPALPVPVRSGGFGGSAGLARYLREHGIVALIDATHPYAATISQHALEAALQTSVPLAQLHRPPWQAVHGDHWTLVADAGDAIGVLGARPQRVFLTLGRQEIAAFGAAPQHHYLIRSVDAVEPPLPVPHAIYLQARGPFAAADEQRLLQAHDIEALVSKNSGGAATYGKIAAARALNIPVLLLRRPEVSHTHRVTDVAAALVWLDHELEAARERGV
jgi:precorrin-6A/cobalt-precorrin-6A reductase